MTLLRQWVSAAQAHLVVSQRGTLNMVSDGAYMVLSLPVSALSGCDDNRDGRLSVDELRAHAASIESQIKQGVMLSSDQGQGRLEGLMLNVSPPENRPSAPSTHLVVLGRFAIDPQASGLALALRLFGTRADEQTKQITVTRGEETQLITLTPEHPQGAVLPSAWVTLVEQVRLGAVHVLSGADHLLFLLVVLAAAWRVRQIVLALTCFTAGHAITLVACVWYGCPFPPMWSSPPLPQPLWAWRCLTAGHRMAVWRIRRISGWHWFLPVHWFMVWAWPEHWLTWVCKARTRL